MNAVYSTPSPRVPADLPEHWERATTTLQFQPTTLDSSKRSPTRRLSAAEKASVFVCARLVSDIPAGFSLLHESAFRLALFRERGILSSMSGQRVASELQAVLRPAHPTVHAHWGWELLCAIDAADLASVWLFADPLPAEPSTRRRPMRLADRVAELVESLR